MFDCTAMRPPYGKYGIPLNGNCSFEVQTQTPRVVFKGWSGKRGIAQPGVFWGGLTMIFTVTGKKYFSLVFRLDEQ